MLNRNEIFEIRLEDYTQPRYKTAIRSYYGTQDEIIDLMNRVTSIDGAKARYSETIEAVACYNLNNEITHTVAGQTLPVLKSVQEVCRFAAQLSDQTWKYTTHGGAGYTCFASLVNVCQNLICTDAGYERCLKVTFSDLRILFPVVGWVSYCRNFKGFPGMVITDGNQVSLALFVSQAHYEFDKLEFAMADAVDLTKIDLSLATADILGEG